MKEKESVNNVIGYLIEEFDLYAKQNGIHTKPSKFFSLEQKEFVLDGNDFSDLQGFFNSIGSLLTINNEWGKNWNALNDILQGGFIKTEYEEPFRLIWVNARKSEKELVDYQDLLNLMKKHKHIDLILK